jgi:muramoyltetrapeptide carboxypeptidase LdcA involved in peptidoglycan recycling
MDFVKLNKLKKGDKIAILSPSFAAPGKWPQMYELGLKRLQEIFELEPVEFPTTKKIGASKEKRSKDLIDAFENKEIKAVIASLGGDDQIIEAREHWMSRNATASNTTTRSESPCPRLE